MDSKLASSPWLWTAIVGGCIALVIGSLWMGLGLSVFALLWARKRLAELKIDAPMRHINHRFFIKALQPWKFAFRLDRVMPYPARKRHTLMVGASGSGKTSLMKLRIMADLEHKNGLLLIDPHGDLAREVARLRYFQEHPERLVYIHPHSLNESLFPSFNPFAYNGKQSPHLISAKVAELATSFESLFRDALSHHQLLLIKRCTTLLMMKQNSTVFDLLSMVQPGDDEATQSLADTHPDQEVRDYFSYSFSERKLHGTRIAVYARLADTLDHHAVKLFLGQPTSSFNLTSLLDAGKVVLIDLSQSVFGSEGTKIIGSLLMAEIGFHGLKRAGSGKRRRPIFIYADEAPLFLTSSTSKMLSEVRKYGIHFGAIACQYLSQFKGTGLDTLKDSLITNSGLKIAGMGSVADLTMLGREGAYDQAKVRPRLRAGTFVISSGNHSFLYSAPDFQLLNSKEQQSGNRFHLSQSEFKASLRNQYTKYYSSSHSPKHASRDRKDQAPSLKTPRTTSTPPSIDPL